MAQNPSEASHLPKTETHWSDYCARGRRDRRFRFNLRRFQFKLSTLLFVVAACSIFLKLMQAFPAGSILAMLLGGSFGGIRGWWRGTFWPAVAGALVAFWTLHWHFLLPGLDWDGGRWPLFAEPFECLLLAAAGSLLGSVVFSGSACETAVAAPPCHATGNRGWSWLWDVGVWVLVGAALGTLAAMRPVGWGVYRPGGEISLCLSAVIYVACLSRNGVIFTTLFFRRSRHWMLAAPVAAAFGVVYLLALREVLHSIYWQNTSAHSQDHLGTVLTVVASSLLFEVSLTLVTLTAEVGRRTERK